jgi:K+-sensing histidine kinase KdpD
MKNALSGILLTLTAAWAMALFRNSDSWRDTIPLALIFVVMFVAARFGTAAAFTGGMLAAALLALCVFPPVGSLSVSDRQAQLNLMWLLLAATAGAELIGPSSNHRPRQ